jgi:hypothetical protein
MSAIALSFRGKSLLESIARAPRARQHESEPQVPEARAPTNGASAKTNAAFRKAVVHAIVAFAARHAPATAN